jgi:hypothetical protein
MVLQYSMRSTFHQTARDSHTPNQVKPFSHGHTLPFMDIPSLFAAFQLLPWRPAPRVAHTFQYLCEAKVGRITKAYAVAHPSFRESVSPRNPLFDSSAPAAILFLLPDNSPERPVNTLHWKACVMHI